MAQDVSGFGLVLTVLASKTYPIGFTVQSFADDADPFDFGETVIAEYGMGLNGDLVTWSKASPLEITVNLIPGSADDIAMSVLVEANRVARGKSSARDQITLVGVYPNGNIVRLTNGRLTSGMVSNSVATNGRLKSKPYKFVFENKGGL